MKAWGLYSARVDPYNAHELIEMFASQDDAELARDNLFGKRVSRYLLNVVWEDDEEFPDLYVRELPLR